MLYFVLILVVIVLIGAICYIRSKIDDKEGNGDAIDITKYEEMADKHQRK